MSEITAEKVKVLLEAGGDMADYQFAADSRDIARAFIAKCEEVEKEVHEKFLIDGENQRLSLENQRLQSIIANQTTRHFIENHGKVGFSEEDMRLLEEGIAADKAIIDAQRDALEFTLKILTNPEGTTVGDALSISGMVGRTLALTDRQITGVAAITKPETHVHNYEHRNRGHGDTYFCICGDSY